MVREFEALDYTPVALAAKGTLPVYQPTQLINRFAQITTFQVPSDDMIEQLITGRSPNLPDYEHKVVLDTMVCTKTTRYSIKELKAQLKGTASSSLTVTFNECLRRYENAIKTHRYATLEAVTKRYIGANERAVHFNLTPYVSQNEIPMFNVNDLKCTISRHNESGQTRNKSSLELRLGNLCDYLKVVDMTVIAMHKCCVSASLIYESAAVNPLKQQCMNAMVNQFQVEANNGDSRFILSSVSELV